MKYALALLLICLGVSIAAAQVIDCPILENAAFTETRIGCTDTAAGQWCYGNAALSASLSDVDAKFANIGDKVDMRIVSQLNTNTGGNLWGVAYGQVEAYPMTGWQPTPVTMIVLGDSSLIDASTDKPDLPLLTLEVTEVDRVNIRSRPTTSARAISGVARGEVIKAFGRLSNDTWLQIQTTRGETGWVSSSIVDADFASLPVVVPDSVIETRLWLPYNAFYLSTSPVPPRCLQAPSSGVLIQTNREASYRFSINEVVIELSGTTFVQATPENGLIVNLLEGEALVTSMDVTVSVDPAYKTSVALGRNANGQLIAAAAPVETELYDHTPLWALPMRLLPRFAYVSFDLSKLIRPRPEDGSSPLGTVLVTDACTITVAVDDVNVRGGPGTDYPVRTTIDFRQSAQPLGRAKGTDGNNWWQLAPDVWISGETTITGGDCVAVPPVETPPPPIQATPTPTSG